MPSGSSSRGTGFSVFSKATRTVTVMKTMPRMNMNEAKVTSFNCSNII